MTALLALALAASPAIAVEAMGAGGWVHEAGDGTAHDAFVLDRAKAGVDLGAGPGGFALRAEAIRSAGPESLAGIDGNSLVLRVERAFGHAGADLGPVRLDGRLGLVPEPFVEAVEGAYELRGVAAAGAEGGGFLPTSDLGATVRAAALDGAVALSLYAQNGEGARDVERNDGTNVGALLAVRALRLDLGRGAGALLVLAGASAGVEWIRALGAAGDGDREADGWAAWASGEPLQRHAGVFARVDRVRQALGVDGAHAERVRAGLYANLAPLEAPEELRVWLAWDRERFGAAAGPAGGALDADRVFVLMSARLGWAKEVP